MRRSGCALTARSNARDSIWRCTARPCNSTLARGSAGRIAAGRFRNGRRPPRAIARPSRIRTCRSIRALMLLRDCPFARLRALLAGMAPRFDRSPIPISLDEPPRIRLAAAALGGRSRPAGQAYRPRRERRCRSGTRSSPSRARAWRAEARNRLYAVRHVLKRNGRAAAGKAARRGEGMRSASAARAPRPHAAGMAALPPRGRGGSWADMLRRHIFAAAGFALLTMALLLLLALITYDPRDPSWDTAGALEPHNLLGREGAIIADLLRQGFGLAAFLLPAILCGWAFRLLLDRPLKAFGRRVALVPFALALGAFALSAGDFAPPPLSGGALGWLLHRLSLRVLPISLALPLAMAAAALVGLLLLMLMGLSWRDWRDLAAGAGRGTTARQPFPAAVCARCCAASTPAGRPAVRPQAHRRRRTRAACRRAMRRRRPPPQTSATAAKAASRSRARERPSPQRAPGANPRRRSSLSPSDNRYCPRSTCWPSRPRSRPRRSTRRCSTGTPARSKPCLRISASADRSYKSGRVPS